MTFDNKLVAIINKDLTPGIGLNALAHMTIGLGAQLDKTTLCLNTYLDKEGNHYPNISQMPFIILRGTSNEIRKTVQSAKTHTIQTGVFLNTMTGGTYQEQLDHTLQTPEAQLVYYGAVLFGPWDTVNKITKKLSLYK